jgi:CHAT domain-containing protein
MILPLVLAAGVVLPTAQAAAPPPPKRTLDDCDAAARDHPNDLPSYLCYWLVARSLKSWDDAARRLDARLAVEPDNHLAQLYLALIEADQRHDDRAKALLDSAAAGLDAGPNATAAVYAWLSLEIYSQIRRDMAAAEGYLRRAQAVAERSGDAKLRARIDTELARQAYLKADYTTALALVGKAKDEMPEDAPLDLKSTLLSTLGVVCWELGRYRDSLDYYERQAALLHEAGNVYLESDALYNIAVLTDTLRGDDGITRKEVRELARRAFDASVAGGNRGIENLARLLLAEDNSLPLDVRIHHAEKVLHDEFTRTQVTMALRTLADLRYRENPAHPEISFGLIDRAIAVAEASGDADEIAMGCASRMNLRWETGPREQAIAESLAALDSLEKVRDRQRDEMVRARWFNRQALTYYQASGRLLDGTPTPEDLELSFTIAERMRARALLDSLDSARATGGRELSGPIAAQRDETLRALADAQRRLVQGTPTPVEKQSILAEIARLEAKEAELRDELVRSAPSLAALGRPDIPKLQDLRALLAPDQALLAFQLSTRRVDAEYSWSCGGSWVFVITKEAARAFPLPDADLLAKEIEVWIGTFPRRDGLERVAAASLYDDLLKQPLAWLPAEVRRLVVVPDRELHLLPFDALAPRAEDEPLGARFTISIAPSATIWARWRRTSGSGAPVGALALADPALPREGAPSQVRQAAAWADGIRLGPLPYARTEARRLSRILGDRCRIYEGVAASEHRLKQVASGELGVLVLATHAVVDEDHPERSAVLLTPGADDEDGLLQPREIVELPLAGSLVVLTSCSSASGTLLRGEGVVGLARAFFEAGARAVVASIWPIKDAEAATVAGAFYEHLSRGESVGTALASARRERMRAGAPAAEWAGLVVIGDGDAIPFPGGVKGVARGGTPIAVVLAGAVLAALVLAAVLAKVGIFRG